MELISPRAIKFSSSSTPKDCAITCFASFKLEQVTNANNIKISVTIESFDAALSKGELSLLIEPDLFFFVHYRLKKYLVFKYIVFFIEK